MIYEIVQLLNVQIGYKKQQVFLVDIVNEDVPAYIDTDLQRLKQILINLLRNSTKFTFEGFIQLTVIVQRKKKQLPGKSTFSKLQEVEMPDVEESGRQ